MKVVNLHKKDIIKEYKRLVYNDFPENEIKDIDIISVLIEKNIFSGMEIFDEDIMVGYCFISQFEGYVYLEYLAIIKKFQNMGYGSKTISALKQHFCKFKAIFCDIEDKDFYINNQEKELKSKRENFYKRNEFVVTNFKFSCWNEQMKLIYLPLLYQPTCDELFECYKKLRLVVYSKEDIYKNIKTTK